MLKYFYISISLLLLKQCFGALNYSEKDWPAQCKSGQSQSPIDIPDVSSAQLTNSTSEFQILSTNYPLFNGISWQILAGSKFYLNVSNLDAYVTVTKNATTYRYDLQELNLHVASEHTIKGYTYDMELQIVHTKNTTWLAEQGVATDLDSAHTSLIVAVLFFSNATTTNLIADSINSASPVSNLDLSSYTSTSNSFFFYEGSFTTPVCDEKVNWVVMSGIQSVTPTQYSLIKTYVDNVYPTGNARQTKALNTRMVYFADMANSLTADDLNFSMIVAAMAAMFIIFFFRKKFEII
jgi:carbonic anhydrase